jgi:chaperonin cofactor prefoldin
MVRVGPIKLIAAGAAVSLVCAGMAVVAQTAAPSEKSAQDKEKIEKELKDLQEQRSKLDARIRDLQKQSGARATRTFTFADPSGKLQVYAVPGGPGAVWFSDGKLQQMKDLTPEQRKHVEEAMAEAKRALEKARKELPEGIVLPDVDALLNHTLRYRALTPGTPVAPFAFDGKEFKAFDSKEFKEQMEKMKDSIRKNVETYRYTMPKVYTSPRTLVTPGIPAVPAIPGTPAIPGEPRVWTTSPDLRNEMRELRKELEQLREELRRERGKGGEEKKKGFTETYSL